MPHNTEEVRNSCKSKHNLRRANQLILLMTTDGDKWHYVAVKKLSTLLKGKTSKHNGDFHCLIFLVHTVQKKSLKSIEMCVRIMIIAM